MYIGMGGWVPLYCLPGHCAANAWRDWGVAVSKCVPRRLVTDRQTDSGYLHYVSKHVWAPRRNSQYYLLVYIGTPGDIYASLRSTMTGRGSTRAEREDADWGADSEGWSGEPDCV